MDSLDFLDDELEKPTVFKDESKLSSEYVPDNLLHRSENLKGIVRHFKNIFTEIKSTRKMVITGPVGCGKTTTAKKFGIWAKKKGKKLNIEYVHVNCRRNKTSFMTLLAVAQGLNPHIPSRGYSPDEMREIIVEMLETNNTTLLLVLDEIDFIANSDIGNLLYTLSRTADNLDEAKHKIALIMISQNPNFLANLDQSTRSSLSASVMNLEPYTKRQLFEIIDERVRGSFLPGSVSIESIVLAAEIAAIRGDARRALELMWYAGKHADKDEESIVYPDHVRLAKADIEPSLLRYAIEELSEHKLMFLLGIARELRYNHAAYITTGNAEEAYNIVCEEFDQIARKHTQVWEYLKGFEASGILVLRRSSKGQRGKTKFISIQDVSAIELEKEVLKKLQEMQPESQIIQ